MKPSNREGIVVILDTVPEIEVVRDYLESATFQSTLPGYMEALRGIAVHEKDTHNPIGERFYGHIAPYDTATRRHLVEPGTVYPIDEQEAQVALSAGKWALGRKWLPARLRNRFSGRTKAAAEMTRYLSEAGIADWSGYPEFPTR
jgi:hypothetical protein